MVLFVLDPRFEPVAQTQDVQHHLIDLYEAPYMASSVKVMVVRALDNTTRFRSGLEWIVGQHRIQVRAAARVYRDVFVVLLSYSCKVEVARQGWQVNELVTND